MFTDASGESRCIAAVAALHEPGGQCTWLWTRATVPPQIWDMLLDRDDHQIGYQEFLGFVLGYHSFGITEAMVTEFIDNDGVLHALINGSGRAPELNFGVGMSWLDMAARDISLHLGRVESKANLADGPSRNDFCMLQGLSAKFVEPTLPCWLLNTWDWQTL